MGHLVPLRSARYCNTFNALSFVLWILDNLIKQVLNGYFINMLILHKKHPKSRHHHKKMFTLTRGLKLLRSRTYFLNIFIFPKWREYYIDAKNETAVSNKERSNYLQQFCFLASKYYHILQKSYEKNALNPFSAADVQKWW